MTSTPGYWAFDRCTVYPLPDNRVLVRNPRNGRQAVLTPDVYHALSECREFRTLDDHARHIAAHNPGLAGQEAAVLEVLESVRKDGLLLSADIYPAQLPPKPTPASVPGRPVAAVITWERPEALARCLDSLADNCDLEQLDRVCVVDDSRTPEIQERNRASALAFAELAPVPVHYFGAKEQKALMEHLIARTPALEDAIRFLIDREAWSDYWTSGLGRTVALLLAVGKRLLVLDDDILCEVFEPHAHKGEVSFADSGRDAAFFASNEEWSAFRSEQDGDPLARHSRVLGMGLEDALGALGVHRLEASAFAGARPETLEKHRADSPVLVTECGSLGDPGTAFSNWLTGLQGDSMARLLASPDSVNNALNIRNCWSGREVAHFGARSNMSQLTGLDNRYLLPPYIPIMRGEDRLFGDMVEFLHPGSVCLDNAWAVPHLPIPERRWTEADRPFDTAEPFPRFCLSLVADHRDTSNSQDPLRRLGHMARLWEDLSELTLEQLREHYIDKRLESQTHRYNHLKSLRQRNDGAPEAWLAYLDEAIQVLNRELLDNPVEVALQGYPENLENERLATWWQDFWKRFGHALRSWPAIRQAAREIMP